MENRSETAGPSSSRYHQNVHNNTITSDSSAAEISEIYGDSILQMMDEPFEMLVDRSKLRMDEHFVGFDNNTGDTWIYPTNYPIRQYQMNITKAALYRNTLVALPTGLGKTFIAAVVMYNIFRWYPTGKIIFMAPTRPLVTQQIEACYNIMGIPRSDTVELTGKQSKPVRQILWQKKRVFFATPQTVQSDLNSGENFPFSSVRLIVIDEAHKAKGKYAYTEVVQSIVNRNRYFRVLALSATPGRHIEDVVEVVRNLLISHVEIRWDNSIDVSPYVHKKSIKTEVVPLGEKLTRLRDEFIQLVDRYVRPLLEKDVVHGSLSSLNKTALLMQQKRFGEVTANHQMPNYSKIMSDFSTSVSLYHALELLEKHGLRIFINFFDDETNSTGEKYFVAKDRQLKDFLASIRDDIGPNPFGVSDETLPDGTIVEMPANLDFGHPKFKILERSLLTHFELNPSSRAIIFCEFRESVLLVHRLLLQNRPLIRPKFIVGKGGTSLGIRAVTEKQQKSVMTAFRDGTVNTLIATCVAEEGIDVGEVDLIICFDINTKNPTRFIQRIGRTGRQRQGRVIMLVTQGHEHDVLKDVMANKDKTNQKIARSGEILKNLYKNCPRLVPTEFDPKCIETHIKIPTEEVTAIDHYGGRSKQRVEKKKVSSPKRKTSKNGKAIATESKSRDVRDFFKKVVDHAEEGDIFSLPRGVDRQNSNHVVFDDDPQPSKSAAKQSNLLKSLLKDQKQLIRSIKNPPKRPVALKPVAPMETILSVENPLADRERREILEWCADFVQCKLEAWEVLEALDANPNDGDVDDNVIILEPQVQELQRDCRKLDDIFGGRHNVHKLVTNFKDKKRYLFVLKSMESGRKFNLPIGDGTTVDSELVYKLKSTLVGLRSQLFDTHQNHDDSSLIAGIQVPSTVVPIYDDFGNDTQFDRMAFNYVSNNVILNTESSYIDQMAAPTVPQTSSMVSTPITKIPGRFKAPIAVENSPLMLAFNRSIEKRRSKFYILSPIFDGGEDRSTLDFFGLSDFDDLFEDPIADDQIKSPDPVASTSRCPRQLFTKVDGHSDTIAKIQSKCTVTQLLQLIENQTKNDHNKSNDKFDLGEIDEIFGTDDEDMFADCDLNDKEPAVQSSNKSQDYFVETKPMPELSPVCVTPPKTVFREKSSDLFDQSSFEVRTKSLEPISNAVELPSKLDIIDEQIVLTSPTARNSSRDDIVQRSPSVIFRRTNINRLRSQIAQSRPSFVTAPASTESTESEFFVIGQDHKKPLETIQLAPVATNEHEHTYLMFSQIPVSRNKQRKRIIESSSSSSDESATIFPPTYPASNNRRKFTVPSMPKKRQKCQFIDDEAHVDTDCSEDEPDNCTDSQQAFLQNSIIDHSTVEDHPSVDMRAIYLRSVNAPDVHHRRGHFKLTVSPRRFKNISHIFSQLPESDDESLDDSFVVHEDDVTDETASTTICPLEKAEAILKARRKEKRKVLSLNGIVRNGITDKRRRKIICVDLDTSSSSDGDDRGLRATT